METIFALSTPPGKGGVAVIRISGPGAGAAIEKLSGREPGAPRQAVLRRLRDPETGAWLDEALVLFFKSPASFTGEDVAELHVHGGRAVVEAVLGALTRLPGLAPAERGAFTRRAFENGRLDLTEVEGLADLIDAETAGQREQALRQMTGALKEKAEDWRARLIAMSAYVEADIDFGEEEGDVGAGLGASILPGLGALKSEIEAVLADGYRGELVRRGLEIAIVGPPNAGKSSLLNWLCGREAAIVSEEAGTTRDVIEARMELAGLPVTMADTAGLREAENAVEAEGVRRALARAETADFRIVMAAVNPEGHEILGSFEEATPDDVCVLNKSDYLDSAPEQVPVAGLYGREFLPISVKKGQGLEELAALIEEKVRCLAPSLDNPVISRERHRIALQECVAGLAGAERWLAEDDVVLGGEELRQALRALGRLTGRVDVEELLDVVFRDFCIGK